MKMFSFSADRPTIAQ